MITASALKTLGWPLYTLGQLITSEDLWKTCGILSWLTFWTMCLSGNISHGKSTVSKYCWNVAIWRVNHQTLFTIFCCSSLPLAVMLPPSQLEGNLFEHSETSLKAGMGSSRIILIFIDLLLRIQPVCNENKSQLIYMTRCSARENCVAIVKLADSS